MLQLLSEVGACSKMQELAGNANLRGETIKKDLIAALGMKTSYVRNN